MMERIKLTWMSHEGVQKTAALSNSSATTTKVGPGEQEQKKKFLVRSAKIKIFKTHCR